MALGVIHVSSLFKFYRKNASYVIPLAMKFTEKEQYPSSKLMAEKTRFGLLSLKKVVFCINYLWQYEGQYWEGGGGGNAYLIFHSSEPDVMFLFLKCSI